VGRRKVEEGGTGWGVGEVGWRKGERLGEGREGGGEARGGIIRVGEKTERGGGWGEGNEKGKGNRGKGGRGRVENVGITERRESGREEGAQW